MVRNRHYIFVAILAVYVHNRKLFLWRVMVKTWTTDLEIHRWYCFSNCNNIRGRTWNVQKKNAVVYYTRDLNPGMFRYQRVVDFMFKNACKVFLKKKFGCSLILSHIIQITFIRKVKYKSMNLHRIWSFRLTRKQFLHQIENGF